VVVVVVVVMVVVVMVIVVAFDGASLLFHLCGELLDVTPQHEPCSSFGTQGSSRTTTKDMKGMGDLIQTPFILELAQVSTFTSG